MPFYRPTVQVISGQVLKMGVSRFLRDFPCLSPLFGVDRATKDSDPIRTLHPPPRSHLLQPPTNQILARSLHLTTTYRTTLPYWTETSETIVKVAMIPIMLRRRA